jgi:hypothetical protein
MPPFVAAILFGWLRTILASIFGGLVVHGWVTNADLTTIITYAAPIIGVALWSAWQKRAVFGQYFTALMLARVSHQDVVAAAASLDKASRPSLLTPSNVVPAVPVMVPKQGG